MARVPDRQNLRPDRAAAERQRCGHRALPCVRWLLQDWPTLASVRAAALRRGIVDLIVEVDGSLTPPARGLPERVRAYRDDCGRAALQAPGHCRRQGREAVGVAH